MPRFTHDPLTIRGMMGRAATMRPAPASHFWSRMPRTPWAQIPADARCAVEDLCGPLDGAEDAADGVTADLAAVLHPADGPAVFCKGVRTNRGPLLRMQRTEAALNPHLAGIAPRMLWQAEAPGWHLLGFEFVQGRAADLSPGSADLGRIADTLVLLYEQLTPAPVDRTLPLAKRWSLAPAWATLAQEHHRELSPWASDNLAWLLAWEQLTAGHIAGDTLAHTDLSRSNFHLALNGRSFVLDWAWPAAAAAWVDTAFMVLRLIGAGRDPADAELWAESVPMWSKASPEGITAFAVAVAGVRTLRAVTHPAPHLPTLVEAATRWVVYRLGLAGPGAMPG